MTQDQVATTQGDSGGSIRQNIGQFSIVLAALIIVLLFWEKSYRRGGGAALLDPRLYKNSSFVFGVTASFFYFAGFTAIFLIMTLYPQQGRGWIPLASGFALVANLVDVVRRKDVASKH
ncbi:hypothetical protein [Actinomyces minihominis]|uniref:hypothetical protein n=1 Tax=Actinomyces minihominis TaxID=2002838 RepID=UPI00101AE091|nr:hypothetical protein [Actinomyces minihominis]